MAKELAKNRESRRREAENLNYLLQENCDSVAIKELELLDIFEE